ncbi:MAG: glycosyltransferase family 2 protein [Bacteroidota bacterium]
MRKIEDLPMISVCIPTYRYDVRPLLEELFKQAEEFPGAFEFLVYDDASPEPAAYGQTELAKMERIKYVRLAENIGRAAIRNKMAKEATHDYLLLLDADGWPAPDFLNDYLITQEHLWRGPEKVAVGGRRYAKQVPAPAFRLHWYYGKKRESASASKRNEAPYLGFQSNNFLVERSVLLAHPFSEKVEGYGHEDTLWGQQLAKAGVAILHVDNPVIHLGLEINRVFLEKQRRAIHNLRLLKKQTPHLRTRLIDLAENYPRLTQLARYLPEGPLLKRLEKEPPSLYLLDLLKLKWWLKA